MNVGGGWLMRGLSEGYEKHLESTTYVYGPRVHDSYPISKRVNDSRKAKYH